MLTIFKRPQKLTTQTSNLLIFSKAIKHHQRAINLTKNIIFKLAVFNNLLLQKDRNLLPDAQENPGDINIRTKILDIVHEVHPGENFSEKICFHDYLSTDYGFQV